MSDAYIRPSFESTNPGDCCIAIDHVSRRVTVAGDLDLDTVPSLVDAVSTLKRFVAGDITLDLHAVTFLDAGTLGALVRLRAQQDARHVGLRVIGNAKLERLADICGPAWLANE